jgi:hypothetical protein
MLHQSVPGFQATHCGPSLLSAAYQFCYRRVQVRYAAVRRQTAAHAGEREVQVLDYQNTAADLLPLLAQAYALLFMVSHYIPLPICALHHGRLCKQMKCWSCMSRCQIFCVSLRVV